MRAALVIKQHQDLQFLLYQRAMAALAIDVDGAGRTPLASSPRGRLCAATQSLIVASPRSSSAYAKPPGISGGVGEGIFAPLGMGSPQSSWRNSLAASARSSRRAA